MFHAKIERDAESIAPDGRAWWQTRVAAILLILAAAIPLVYPAIPPLVDVPGHMGQYRVELDLAGSPDLQRYFTFHWRLIGNLGVDLLVIPLSKLFGLEFATKLIVITIPSLTVAGFLAVAKQVHGRLPPTALLALPLAYSQPMNYGFVNFTLGIALALLAFAGWLRLAEQRRFRLRALVFAPLSILLFIVHTYGWAFLGVLTFANEFVSVRQRQKGWLAAVGISIRRCLVLALPLAMIVAWRGDAGVPMFPMWPGLKIKAFWLISVFRYNNRDLEMGLAFLAYCIFPFIILRSRPLLSRSLLTAAGLLLAVFLILPWIVFGSHFADMRLAAYLLATAILAVGASQATSRTASRIALTGAIFYAAFLTMRAVQFAHVADDQQRQLAALAHIPDGARVVTLVGNDCGNDWDLPINSHLGSYIIVRRSGFSNDQWLTPDANLLGLRDILQDRFASDPSQMVWQSSCRPSIFQPVDSALAAVNEGSARYLWLIDVRPANQRALGPWRKLWSDKKSALYRRAA